MLGAHRDPGCILSAVGLVPGYRRACRECVMLVLSRRPGQVIVIGENVELVILGIDGGQVRVGIRAPRDITVLRKELVPQADQHNRRAATASDATLETVIETSAACPP